MTSFASLAHIIKEVVDSFAHVWVEGKVNRVHVSLCTVCTPKCVAFQCQETALKVLSC